MMQLKPKKTQKFSGLKNIDEKDAIFLRYVEGVYRDAEDSWLLQEQVKQYAKPGMKVIDIGTGTGIQAITAAKQGAEVTAVDLNPMAVELAKQNAEANEVKITAFESDLFSKVEGRFDLIIFNAPYLPPLEPTDLTWSGGKEIIYNFIGQAKEHLNPGGKILFVFSTQTGLTNDKGEIKIIDVKSFSINSDEMDMIGITSISEEIYVGLIEPKV